LLYELTLEPVLEQIRGDSLISGVFVPGMGEKQVSAYADDTAFLLSNVKSIKSVLDSFEAFGKASGAKVNVTKSTIMGIGKWANKTDFPFQLQQVNKLKVYGIEYWCKPTYKQTTMWNKLKDKIASMLNRYKYKTTTIFGRSIVVNTFVISKLIYIANVFPVPIDVIRDINKQIRRFIFSRTIHSIKHSTLIQDKWSGGISLQDIATKIKALRIKYVGEMVKNAAQYPLAHYYIGIRISDVCKLNNSAPHHFGSLPLFYKECIQGLRGNEHLLNKETRFVYKQLVKLQATPLIFRIKRGYKMFISDYTETFTNLHKIKISPQAKEITFRLIYNITPTYRAQQMSKCKLCKKNVKETEDHLFYQCKVVTPVIEILKEIIEMYASNDVDMYKVITLNMIPKVPRDVEHKILILLAEFRRLVWCCRIKCVFEQRTYTPELFALIFDRCTSYVFE
jgi:hypothetical protein